MKIIRTKDYQDMSRKAANIISAQMILKDDSVLGLATGSTPIGIYDQLVDWYKKGDLDFSKITTVNLDEYKGLPKENDQSYWYFMNKNLFSRVNIRPDLDQSHTLHKEDPPKQGPNGDDGADDHELASQLAVAAHVLGHGIRGSSHRRSVDRHQKEQLQIPEALGYAFGLRANPETPGYQFPASPGYRCGQPGKKA